MFQNNEVYCWQRIKCNNQAINQEYLQHYIKRQIKKTTVVSRSHLLTNVKLMIKKIEFPWQLVFLQLHAAIKEPSKKNLHLLLIQKCSRKALRNASSDNFLFWKLMLGFSEKLYIVPSISI